MINGIFKPQKLAIDFGTANCVIILSGKGVVLTEPTVVAISVKEKKILAVGQSAKLMLGKVPEGIDAKRPLKNGGISNYKLAEALLKKFMKKVMPIHFLKPEAIVSVPAGINSVEERAIIQALTAVGIGHIFLLPEPVAAAIGAQMPIHTSTGNVIVNLGGGTAEIAVISLNGVVSYESHKGAGDSLNDSIVAYVKKEYNLLIGEITAEDIKIEIGSALKMRTPLEKEIRGRNIKTGLPMSVTLNSNELVDPLRVILNEIVSSIKRVLSKTPPELMSDIVDRGIVLSGGTSMLRGMDELITKSVGIPAHLVEEPLTCVVRGLSIALENINEFKRALKN